MRDDEEIHPERTDLEPVDARIDAALRSYAEPPRVSEPRVALAQILSRAEAERTRRARRWIWAAVPVCALLVVALIAVWTLRGPRVPEIAWIPRTPAAVPAPHAVAVKPFGAEARHSPRMGREEPASASSRSREPLPKQDVFPTPRPLSPQEQALVAFVSRAPAGVRQAVIDSQQQWDQPITVSEVVVPEVKIRPLGEDEQQNLNLKTNPER
jgi:hypothetical protein